jgi:small subunit ribosomal protein S21
MVVNVRVENKHGFEQMKKLFRRAVNESGVLHDLRQRERYEKPSEKKRRKRRQMEREKYKANMEMNMLNGNTERRKR